MVSNQLQVSEYKLKKPSVAFLLCLLIAGGVWLFSVFSKEYTVTLDYQVICSDLPANRQSVTQSDSVVNLTFQARGFTFLNPKYSDRKRVLNISVNNITKNRSKRNVYSFNKKALNEYIRNMPGFENDFLEIESPESITIYLK